MTANVVTDVNRPYVPGSGAKLTAEIEVEPGQQDERPTRQIALCIDASGSMAGDEIARARSGAEWVFGLLEDDDYVSIVAFDSDVHVVLDATRWGDVAREDAMETVADIAAGGGTDMYRGLAAAADSLRQLPDDGNTARRVLLLSDGKDNTHDTPEFETLAREIDSEGIRIKSAGIGSDYREETIRTLGSVARGEWTHLEAAGDIEDFFGDAVEEAGTVVAPDARLELDVADGVEVSEVYRALPQTQEVTPEWEANTTVVKLPDLLDRETQRVVLKVHAPARDIGQEVTLADVTLTADGETATGAITVEYTDDAEKLGEHNEGVDVDHRQTVIKTELGKGNVAEAQTQIERMTQVHGADTEAVEAAERQTEIVMEGGREEQSKATKIVTDEGLQK
ncbi:VWA domain-containing protein [Halomicroarcula sp. S1AR25-4]|uniref:vWA domain-containing protein n=1 Tax=Haloarcula sp. S1AR25-4 TaxID=2950538 RepID=UPI0028763A9E|nr:VWA domain-containing protein [Halomicroarcula sp. S1AR25-4]MDS0276193.1 VWA domain-containing protein [Halomicroarcula sp. S1AR25-4]